MHSTFFPVYKTLTVHDEHLNGTYKFKYMEHSWNAAHADDDVIVGMEMGFHIKYRMNFNALTAHVKHDIF